MDDYGVPGSLGLHKTTETEQRGAQATHRGWNHVTQTMSNVTEGSTGFPYHQRLSYLISRRLPRLLDISRYSSVSASAFDF